MTDKLNKSASVTPPLSGKNTIVLGSGTSSRRIKIPESWKGWITIQADGCEAWVSFGGSTITAAPSATSTITSDELASNGTGECQHIPEDTSLPVNLDEIEKGPKDRIYLADIESATGGYLRIIRSSGRVSLS